MNIEDKNFIKIMVNVLFLLQKRFFTQSGTRVVTCDYVCRLHLWNESPKVLPTHSILYSAILLLVVKMLTSKWEVFIEYNLLLKRF